MRVSHLIKPRTIFLITSHAEGEDNVATFSFVMPVSFSPKIVCFSIAPSRHTYSLLKKNKECVLNIVTPEMEDIMWYCGTHTGREEDKFKEKNIDTEKSDEVKPLRIKKSPVQIGCRIKEFLKSGDHTLVLCKVVEEHVKKQEYETMMHISGKETIIV